MLAGRRKSWLSYFRRRRDEDISPNLLKNGGALLQKLIAVFGGRYENPINHFTAQQLTTATNHFADRLHKDSSQETFKGSLEGRSILVTKHFLDYSFPKDVVFDCAITNIAFSSQISHLKNVVKFIGCCLEFEYPVLVYEAAETQVLDDFFTSSNNDNFLPWKSRVRIANDIASTLTYLHTAFSAPIIHRDVKLRNVIIDQYGNANLFNFSLSISLPPGKKEVFEVAGTYGYLDPEYVLSGEITPKVDVYSFGILLLDLLAGRLLNYRHTALNHNPIRQILDDTVLDLDGLIVDHNRVRQIVDIKIWETEEEAQFKAFLDLALRCTKVKGDERPDMVDVAKELIQIEKNVLISSSI